MAVRKRGNGYLIDVYTPQKRVRKTAKTLEQALALEEIIRNNGRPAAQRWSHERAITPDTKLSHVLEYTALKRWDGSRLGKELKSTARGTINLYFRGITVAGFNREYRRFLGSIDPYALASLRAVINTAVEAGALEFNVIPLPKPEPYLRELREMTGYGDMFEKHVLRYLREQNAERFRDFLIAIIDTGLNTYNLRKISVEQIKRGSLHFKKGNHALEIKLSNRALQAFKRNNGREFYFEGLGNSSIRLHMDKLKYFFGLEDHDRLDIDVFRNHMLDYHITGDVPYATLKALLGGGEFLLDCAVDYNNQSPEYHEERSSGDW